jgi:hypothetical protein
MMNCFFARNPVLVWIMLAGSGPYDVWVGELLYSGFAHAGIGFNWTGWLLMKLCIVLWITQYLILHQELAYLICRSASCMKPFRTGHK